MAHSDILCSHSPSINVVIVEWTTLFKNVRTGEQSYKFCCHYFVLTTIVECRSDSDVSRHIDQSNCYAQKGHQQTRCAEKLRRILFWGILPGVLQSCWKCVWSNLFSFTYGKKHSFHWVTKKFLLINIWTEHTYGEFYIIPVQGCTVYNFFLVTCTMSC